MEIYMQKIGLIRDDVNPKNLSLNLDIDWAVEYKNTDQEMIDFADIETSAESEETSVETENEESQNSMNVVPGCRGCESGCGTRERPCYLKEDCEHEP